jgi:hypothetical protein
MHQLEEHVDEIYWKIERERGIMLLEWRFWIGDNLLNEGFTELISVESRNCMVGRLIQLLGIECLI